MGGVTGKVRWGLFYDTLAKNFTSSIRLYVFICFPFQRSGSQSMSKSLYVKIRTELYPATSRSIVPNDNVLESMALFLASVQARTFNALRIHWLHHYKRHKSKLILD